MAKFFVYGRRRCSRSLLRVAARSLAPASTNTRTHRSSTSYGLSARGCSGGLPHLPGLPRSYTGQATPRRVHTEGRYSIHFGVSRYRISPHPPFLRRRADPSFRSTSRRPGHLHNLPGDLPLAGLTVHFRYANIFFVVLNSFLHLPPSTNSRLEAVSNLPQDRFHTPFHLHVSFFT